MTETAPEPAPDPAPPEPQPEPDAPEPDAPEGKIVKSSPEMPTPAQVAAAETTVPAVDEPKVTVGDGDREIELRPDDAARLASTIASSTHPAFTEEGPWGAPELSRENILGKVEFAREQKALEEAGVEPEEDTTAEAEASAEPAPATA
ncbi:MAG TPA: hypothetical protein VH541_05425 [Gaiellaceae bacterium]|jgi:hypothetical protein